MMTPKNFLIGTVILVVLSFFFDWFDDVMNIAGLALLFAWLAFYEALKTMEVNNKNLDKIEKRFEQIENKF